MADGYAMVIGTCFACQRIFGFNPHKVPSIKIGPDGKPAEDGTRQPICRNCAEIANRHRTLSGLPLFNVTDEAYGPIPEGEL